MKVVIDTNVLVGRAISERGIPARIFQLWEAGAIDLLVSQAILEEYRRALGHERTRKRHGYSEERIAEVMKRFTDFATVVEPNVRLSKKSRHTADDKFLECAASGKADYIISGDAHLLALKEYEGIRIVTPADFLRLLDQQ